MIPDATLVALDQSVAIGRRRTQTRTQRTKEHEAGEGDGPQVHGVEYAATVELEEEQALDALPRGVASNNEPTNKPSANQLFKANIR